MRKIRILTAILLLLSLLAGCGPAVREPDPFLIRETHKGTVDAIDGNVLTIRYGSGVRVTVALDSGTVIRDQFGTEGSVPALQDGISAEVEFTSDSIVMPYRAVNVTLTQPYTVSASFTGLIRSREGNVVTLEKIELPEDFAAAAVKADGTSLPLPGFRMPEEPSVDLTGLSFDRDLRKGDRLQVTVRFSPEDGEAPWPATEAEYILPDPEVTVYVDEVNPNALKDGDVTRNGFSVRVSNGLTYIGGVLIANKTYALPSSYDPGGLTRETKNAFNEMKEAAALDGIDLWIVSGYRSYDTQYAIYWRYVRNDGQKQADTYSARPGYSEHQTGMAMDINSLKSAFADTEEGKWLAEHAHEYGFILRYPSGKSGITGYVYEPWHFRYVGREMAEKVYESGLCLEEYLGIDSVYFN